MKVFFEDCPGCGDVLPHPRIVDVIRCCDDSDGWIRLAELFQRGPLLYYDVRVFDGDEGEHLMHLWVCPGCGAGTEFEDVAGLSPTWELPDL